MSASPSSRPDPAPERGHTAELGRTVTALRREREWRERVVAMPSHRAAAATRATARRTRRVLGRLARRALVVATGDRAEVARKHIDEFVDAAATDPLADPRPLRARRRVAGVPGPTGQPTDVVFLLVVLDARDQDLADLLATVREVQRGVGDGGDVGVVVATDSDAFHLFRRPDLLFEHLPPRERWEALPRDVGAAHASNWDQVVACRLQLLVDTWRPDAVLAVDAAPDARGTVAALLAANVRAHLPPT